MREVTAEGSSSVDVSPRCAVSPVATLRRILRMIFPLRVLGSAGALCTTSGAAKGPISLRTFLHDSM